MTKITNSKVLILLIATASVGILGSISFSGTVDAQDAIMDNLNDDLRGVQAKAIPDWVNNNFKWYGEGLIEQSDLLNSLSFLLDNGHMHLSDKAAQEVNDLRAENAELKKKTKLGADGIVGPKTNSDSAVPKISSIQIPNEDGELVDLLLVTDESTDVNALVQWVLKQSYLETNKDLQFYADKVRYYNDMKEAIRDHVSDMRNKRQMAATAFENAGDASKTTPKNSFGDMLKTGASKTASKSIQELIEKGDTNPSTWGEAITEVGKQIKNQNPSSDNSAVDDLAGMIVLCEIAMDKEIHALQAEISVLQDLSDRHVDDATGTTRAAGEPVDGEWWGERLFKVDQKIKSLKTGLEICTARSELMKVDLQDSDDAALANIDLQNSLQKQQQLIQTMSNVSKMLHDTAMAVIRKIG